MKSFLKKRWHHLPMGIVTAVLAVCLLAGGAFAAYNFFTATAEVKVGEPFTFGVNYVGWEAPSGADMIGGYYSQSSPFTCSVALLAGESSHGNPDLPEAIRDLMPPLTIGDTPAPGIPSPYHTFNSFAIENDAGVPIVATFTVAGETTSVYMVWWGEEGGQQVVGKLNGYTPEVLGNDFIMKGIGVVAEEDAEPGDFTFTVTISRG